MSLNRPTHLEYYKTHGIAPVQYDLSSVDAHLQRRRSLYNMAGLPPLAFRGSRILEVAAGTGQNSLYLASQMPAELVLLEPNPTAIERIHQAYATFDRPHTKPAVITTTLEEYAPEAAFDIVLCENWLGTAEHELALMKKLSEFVSDGGVLVVTILSPIGFAPNVLRRFFVPYIAPAKLSFDERTRLVDQAYAPHLKTLPAMTRSSTDWVQDNMLNPAYFGICVAAPLVLANLGSDFQVIGSSPSFAEDWRWFKSLHGDHRPSNEHFLDQYWRKCHNYLDWTAATFASDPVRNRSFEANALDLLHAIERHEHVLLHGLGDTADAVSAVAAAYERYVGDVPDELSGARAALEELKPYVLEPSRVTAPELAELARFGSLFGRETSYLSLLKT